MRVVAFYIAVTTAACESSGTHRRGAFDATTSNDQVRDGGRDAAPRTDASLDSAPADACTDLFRLDGHGAAMTCWLTGDFVGWGGDLDHGAIPLAKGSDGAWTGSHVFTAGTYQYKFILDGTMYFADPDDPLVVDDGFGGHNSLYTCTP